MLGRPVSRTLNTQHARCCKSARECWCRLRRSPRMRLSCVAIPGRQNDEKETKRLPTSVQRGFDTRVFAQQRPNAKQHPAPRHTHSNIKRIHRVRMRARVSVHIRARVQAKRARGGATYQRRCDRQVRHSVFLNGTEKPLGIKRRHRYDRGTAPQRGMQDRDHAIDVVKREHTQHNIMLRDPHVHRWVRHALRHVCREVGVRQHHSFREPGSATRVRQHQCRLRCDRGWCRRQVACVRSVAAAQRAKSDMYIQCAKFTLID